MSRELLKKADANLKASIKNIAENSPKGEVIEEDDYLISTIGRMSTESHANAAFCLDTENAEETFKKVDKYYKDRGMSYVFWIREDIDSEMEEVLKKKGYVPKREPGLPIMAVDRRIEIPELEEEYRAVRVKNSQEMRDFITVVRDCFSLGENTAQAMFASSNVLDGKVNKAYVVYDKSRPVSAVQTYNAGGVSGIYWVATSEDMRGKGLGKFITAVGTDEAFNLGAENVVLQASTLGGYVYEKLGYEIIGYYRTYLIEI